MPRFFFHLKDGTTHMDQDGVELVGADEAREAAIIHSGEVLKDLEPSSGSPPSGACG